MNELRQKAKQLLGEGAIDIFIAYEEGTKLPRPILAESEKDTENLVFDEKCTGNLAVYLTRKDLVKGKKVAITASYYALKSIVQLFNENQLKEDSIRIFVLEEDNNSLKELDTKESVLQFLQSAIPPPKQSEEEIVKQIDSMSVEERWQFWTNEMSKCFKCYACRAACPMCYCSRCIVEVNRPQWIQPWSSTLSNMEWQINRVMHMAGRCSDCGSCGAACPLGIPIHILTHKMSELVKLNFGDQNDKGNVLSTFKPEDKESFIL